MRDINNMNKLIYKKIYWIFIIPLLCLVHGCGIYSLSGASIPDEMKSVTIRYFENSAPLVVPYLSQRFTKGLEDRIRNNSRLTVVRNDGDAVFEGRITGYSVVASAVTGNNQSTSNRLTITVHVKYTNNLKSELSFEKDFTGEKDFSIVSRPLEAQQEELITEIINLQLTDKIFNDAFANW